MTTQLRSGPTTDPSIRVSRQPVLDVRDAVLSSRAPYSLLSEDSPPEPAGEEASRAVHGPFPAAPTMVSGTPIPIGDLHTIIELYRMKSREASAEELISVIEREEGLGVRLLKYMNSSYFGFSGRVRSIRQAATILGARGLSRWALSVASLNGSRPVPRELALLTLTRARACELVGLDHHEQLDGDELFTVGMLSTCEAVFGMPMSAVVEQLPLSGRISQALLHGTGSAGEILQSVISYERSELLGPTLPSSTLINSAAYREALDWAQRATSGMA